MTKSLRNKNGNSLSHPVLGNNESIMLNTVGQSATMDLYSRTYKTFMASLKSDATRDIYTRSLNKLHLFSKNHRVQFNTFDELTQLPKADLNELLEDFLLELRESGRGGNTIATYLAGIQSFMEFNDVDYSIKRMKKLVPKKNKPAGAEGYKMEQIQFLIDDVSKRTRATLLLLASSGIRKGGLLSLKVGDLIPIEDCYMIVVYRGETEEYVTFCTPECKVALTEYFEERKAQGELFSDSTPVFGALFEPDKIRINNPESQFNSMMQYLISAKKFKRERVSDIRYNVSMAHGFRKFCNTQLHKVRYEVDGKAIPAIASDDIEKILGHKNGLKGLYYTPEASDLFQEYKKAIPYLTIQKHLRQEKTITNLQSQLTTQDAETAKQVEELKEFIKVQEDRIVRLEKGGRPDPTELVALAEKILREYKPQLS